MRDILLPSTTFACLDEQAAAVLEEKRVEIQPLFQQQRAGIESRISLRISGYNIWSYSAIRDCSMDPAALEVVPQVAGAPGFAFNLLPASVLVAIITQAWITCRERNERVRRRLAALAAIESEFEVIVTSLNDFWEKVQKAWDESRKDALVRFCTIPYPEGALAAWASSLRTLLPMLPADQIREKIEWLYVIEAMNTL